jgi:hypothetical protein
MIWVKSQEQFLKIRNLTNANPTYGPHVILRSVSSRLSKGVVQRCVRPYPSRHSRLVNNSLSDATVGGCVSDQSLLSARSV